MSDGSVSATDRVEVLLSSTNSLPPVAVATGPAAPVELTGQAGQTVRLVGSASTDPDNDPLTYSWLQVAGPEMLVFAPGSSSTDADVDLLAPSVPGNFEFQLLVDDGTNAAVADTVSFSFVPPNRAPVADAGAPQTLQVAASTVITLDGSASTDADGDTITYAWTQTAGTPVTLSDPTAAQPTFSYLPSAQETLEFQLVVNDGTIDSAPATTSVTLEPGVTVGTLPAVNVVERADRCEVAVTYDITGFTADQNNTQDLFSVAVTSGSGNSVAQDLSTIVAEVGVRSTNFAPIRAALNLGSASSEPFSVTLFDIDSARSPVAVLDQEPLDFDQIAGLGANCRAQVKSVRGNSVPVADAGPNQTINNVDASTTVTLDASASTDADSDTLTYRWVQTSGPAVTLDDATSATPSFMSVPAMMDAITFDLFVSDGTDESAADTVTIRLNRANTLPVAEAGPAQALRTARPGASQTPQSLVLDGSASTDADNDALTYRWAQVAGPVLTLAPGSSLTDAAPVFEAPGAEGTVTFELIVNDGFGDSPADTVEATYTFFENAAPVVDAGPDQTVDQAVGQVSVQLAATGTDPENTALTYSWTQLSGPAVTLSDPSLANPTFGFDMTGQSSNVVFVFAVAASDGALTSASDEVTITLTPNAVPVADAGPDQTLARLEADTVVQLDGTGSTDGDNDTLSYAWTQVAGPAVTLSSATEAQPTFSFDPGTDTSGLSFTFELVVDDGIDASAPDRVTIDATPNNPPVADAGRAQVEADYVAGAPIQLDGRSSSDPNGDTLTYQWTQLSGPSVTLDDPASATPSFAYDPSEATGPNTAQTFEFGLVVSDGTRVSQRATVRVTLTVNDPPEADAGEDQTLETPADGTVVTLDGSSSSDPEGDALSYAWVQTGGRDVTLSDATAVSPTFTYDYPDPLPAEEVFTFALTLNDGNQDSVADEVVITVINNQAPTANAGADIGPINAGDIVTLNGGQSTDPDADALTYAWTQVSGPAVDLSDATSQSPTFTAPDVGSLSELVFELVVNDGRVDSLPDRVSVSVQPVGSIRIVQRVSGPDGTFVFTSNLADLNAAITTSGGVGELTAERVGTGAYTVTARDARDQGFALTDLVCSDDDSTTDVAARQASIQLAPGEDVTCTFTSVNSREAARKAIRTALVARSQLLLAAEPDSQRRIDRLKGRTASGRGAQIAGMVVPGTDALGLSANLSERSATVSGSLASANAGGVLADSLDAATKNGKLDVWMEGSYQGFDFQGQDGDFSVLYLGADYLASDTLLVGGVVQVDDFTFGDTGEAGFVDGTGFMVGPYATKRFGDNLYVDARAAWGSSGNSVNPLGTFSDDFDTNRALYALNVSGDWTTEGQLNIRPEASLRFLSETQESYTDSLGVVIPEQSVDLGELAFGPRLAKPFAVNRRCAVTPWGEAKGVVSFGNAARDILQDDFRLRLEGGADWSTVDGIRAGVSAFSDGLGSDDLESYGIRLSLSYTMK